MSSKQGFWEDAIAFSETLGYERNLYKRMLMQNRAEIAMAENGGMHPKYVKVLNRIMKPITIFETLNHPFIVLCTVLIMVRLRKKKRLTRLRKTTADFLF